MFDLPTWGDHHRFFLRGFFSQIRSNKRSPATKPICTVSILILNARPRYTDASGENAAFNCP
ncbi:unnamed protein product [Callosobruchus maculatus]|uniref:Uncharacterized protein n=1 Tax=Callosobruchus maculatus TaxID=64391 RepID=A0A653DDC5_CALMS|nr:unnamed protein product [Callosobruchus maculatus]